MKKLVRNLFAVIAATALVGSFASCADSDAEDPFATTSTNANSAGGNGGAGNGGGDNGNQGAQGAGQAKYTNNEITFPVTEASTNAEKTVLLVKYDRTAAGKAELIKVTNAGLKVWKNGKLIKTIDTIEFALDDYGASFSGATGQISDENDMKEYKVKLSIGDTVAVGDTIKVKLDEKAFIEAIGKDAANVNPESVVVALVDIDPSVNYYKELCENSDLYKPFLTKKEENTQQGGGGTGGQQPTDGTGTGGQQPSGNGGNGGQAAGAQPTPVTYTTARKAYTLTTTKDLQKDDVGLTFQYFVASGETPVSVGVSGLKVSVKIGDANAVVKTLDAFTIEHHSYDTNAAESNVRVNLGLGEATETIASGTTVVLQILEATVSDSSKASGITFALQKDGKHAAWDMATAADSHPFAEATESSASQNTGNGGAATSNKIVSTLTSLTIPVNTYAGETNIQLYKPLSELGLTGFNPQVGEIYTIYMKGTVTCAKDNINNMCVGFTKSYSWDNGAMEGGFDIGSASLAAGVSKDVTFKGDFTLADLNFWLYNDKDADATKYAEATIALEEFSVTKKN